MNDEVLSLIAQYGFPIVVSIYLLMRMEGKIENLSNAITQLVNGIDKFMDNKK